MVKTQIQLPDDLYRRVKRLAERKEWSMAEILRRGAEHMVAVHPEADQAPDAWTPPRPRAVGIHPDLAPVDLRRLAHERPVREGAARGKSRR
jgi:hypothetical protein